MPDLDQLRRELAAIAKAHAGASPVLPGLTIRVSGAVTDPIPALFDPVFYVILQGTKRMTFAGTTSEYQTGTCAVATVGLPFVSQVIEASPDQPYVGTELRLDPALVADIVLAAPDLPVRDVPSFASATADEATLEPFGRLLRLLDTPADAPVLATPYLRELCYRLLQGPLGPTLRQLGQRNARTTQVRAAADWIGGNTDQRLSVGRLAADVGMSATSLHRHFKAVTGYSPLAYQRYLRLLEARRLLLSGAAPVTSIAYRVGYGSASQFSREYKRMFGEPPIKDAHVRPVSRSRDRLQSKTSGTPLNETLLN